MTTTNAQSRSRRNWPREGVEAANASRCARLLLGLSIAVQLCAHDATPVTHSFERGTPRPGPRLTLSVREAPSGKSMPARFSLLVDGNEYVPEWIDEHGVRFTSIHRSKRQQFTALYASGNGPVTVGLPPGAREVEVVATRGFEYIPTRVTGRVDNDRASLELSLSRWSNLEAQGWIAVDEHLHYDRMDPAANSTWLTALAADGLAMGHFMVLKGGMMPGVWARQHAYGHEGQASDGHGVIVPGEEYRDRMQGHINLLGVGEVIEPISTGGMVGDPEENFPAFHDVLLKARSVGALTGVAHGGTLSRSPTAVADAILGAVDFWEVSNGFIHSTDLWYRLMNCGIFVPPAAGTDLPNWPFRDPWQPMLGSVRTYVHTGGRIDFESFKTAMKTGRIFISGGPIIQITVEGKSAGDIIRLPAGGGTVRIRAELASTQPLRELQLIHNGKPVEATVTRSKDEAVQRWTVEHSLKFTTSGWVAAAGAGMRIQSLGYDTKAHTGVVRVLVGDQPIRYREDLTHLIAKLGEHHELYRKEGRYRTDADRAHALALIARARDTLRDRLEQEVQRSQAVKR